MSAFPALTRRVDNVLGHPESHPRYPGRDDRRFITLPAMDGDLVGVSAGQRVPVPPRTPDFSEKRFVTQAIFSPELVRYATSLIDRDGLEAHSDEFKLKFSSQLRRYDPETDVHQIAQWILYIRRLRLSPGLIEPGTYAD